MGKGYPMWLWLSTAMALCGSIQFGYHLGVLNTCLEHVATDLKFSEAVGAVVVSALLVGAAIGSLGAGGLADRLGPRTALLANNVPLLLGISLCGTAGSLWTLLVGRAVCGLGAGGASVLVPRYLAEIAPDAIRGGLGTLNQVFINVGITSSYVMGLPYQKGPAMVSLLGHAVPWWRAMFMVALVPCAVQATGLALCPESPEWLVWRGRLLRARDSWRRLHGTRRGAPRRPGRAQGGETQEERQPLLRDGADSPSAAPPPPPPSASRTTAATQREGGAGAPAAPAASEPLPAPPSPSPHQHHPPARSAPAAGPAAAAKGWAALLQPRYRRVMTLAVALPLFQQLSGINTVIFYSSQVFKMAGLASPVLGSIAMGCANLCMTLVTAALMDSMGRKRLLTWSHSGMAACLAAMSAFIWLPTSKSLEGSVSFCAILSFALFFALGAGPIPWVYLPEILPQEIKGAAQSLCTCLNWVSNLAVGLTFPAMLRTLHIGGSYAVYAALNTVAAVFMY